MSEIESEDDLVLLYEHAMATLTNANQLITAPGKTFLKQFYDYAESVKVDFHGR